MQTQIRSYLAANPQASKREICRKFGIGVVRLEGILKSEGLKISRQKSQWCRQGGCGIL